MAIWWLWTISISWELLIWNVTTKWFDFSNIDKGHAYYAQDFWNIFSWSKLIRTNVQTAWQEATKKLFVLFNRITSNTWHQLHVMFFHTSYLRAVSTLKLWKITLHHFSIFWNWHFFSSFIWMEEGSCDYWPTRRSKYWNGNKSLLEKGKWFSKQKIDRAERSGREKKKEKKGREKNKNDQTKATHRKTASCLMYFWND